MNLRVCPISGLPVQESYVFANSRYLYKLIINDKIVQLSVPLDYNDWDNEPIYFQNKHVVAGLFLNEQLVEFRNEVSQLITLDFIKQKINEYIYPITPKEKYDLLFLKLFNFQMYDGAPVDYQQLVRRQGELFYKKLYFKYEKEMEFYINTMAENKHIDLRFENRNSDIIMAYNFTYEGIKYAVGINNEGKQSKNCFIAMSFGDDMNNIRNAIKEACIQTGYLPILIDEIHHDSDMTINDAIIANLKKSRFCIADFTEQKKGVYFESGFALGQGKQVIYSCREDYFIESHFDTNHFPHIIYKQPEELKTKLITKIEAWIR